MINSGTAAKTKVSLLGLGVRASAPFFCLLNPGAVRVRLNDRCVQIAPGCGKRSQSLIWIKKSRYGQGILR